VWTFTGVPFLAFIAMILLMHLLFGFERMNWIAALSQTVGPFCMLVGHIVGGAIAGFHIDYFLLNVAPNP
jgi:hypothetical protein